MYEEKKAKNADIERESYSPEFANKSLATVEGEE